MVVVFAIGGAVLRGPGGFWAGGVVRGEFLMEGIVAAGGGAGRGGVLGHGGSGMRVGKLLLPGVCV